MLKRLEKQLYAGLHKVDRHVVELERAISREESVKPGAHLIKKTFLLVVLKKI